MFNLHTADFGILKTYMRFLISVCFSAAHPRVSLGRDSSVGIATRYRLDGPGIESRCGRDFPPLSIPALRPTQPPMQWVPGLFRG